MRLFIAVPVSGEFLESAEEIQKFLMTSRADVKWVPPANMHLTLHFLGEVGDWSPIREILARAGDFAEFDISLGAAGAFPSVEHPRVLWAGITEGAGNLKKIAEFLGAALAEKGFKVDSRPFSPHLTLGRVRGPGGIRELARLLTEIPASEKRHILKICSLHLVESRLGPGGPSYTAIYSSPLRKA